MRIDGGDMAITLDSLRKSQKAVSKEVPYNQEKLEYKVRLPESVQLQIIHMRTVDKMYIEHIGTALNISAATVRKVLVQNNIPTGNINNRKD